MTPPPIREFRGSMGRGELWLDRLASSGVPELTATKRRLRIPHWSLLDHQAPLRINDPQHVVLFRSWRATLALVINVVTNLPSA